MKIVQSLLHATGESGRQSKLLPGQDGLDVLAEITAELGRATPAIAWISDAPRSGRSGLLERLEAHLVGDNVRIIVVDDADGEPIGIRRFCQLLVAASPSHTSPRDFAEHFAATFTSPRAGERGLALIVENADALTAEALAFAERLAVASGARPFRVQVLLIGSYALESRLPEVGPVVVKKRAYAAPRVRSIMDTARTRGTRPGLAALGAAATLIVVAAVAAGDQGRERVPAQATLAAGMLPANAAPSADMSPHEATPAAEHPAEPAPVTPPVTMSAQETNPAKEQPAEPDTLQLPVEKVPPGQVDAAAAEPSAVFAAPSPASSRHDVAIASPAESDAAPVPAPAPAATPTTEQAPAASEPLAQSAPEMPPVAATGAVSPASSVPPDSAAPSVAETASVASPAPSPTSTTDQAPAAAGEPLDQSAPGMPPVAAAGAASSPASVPPEAAAPSVAQTANVASPAAPPTPATDQGPAVGEPLAQAAAVAATGAVSPPSPVPPDAAAPGVAEAANGALPAPSPTVAASPAPQTEPEAKPSPAAVAALLGRGDELIAIGDVAAARVVYQRAATLKSGRGATLTGRTYDPRFLHQIGAVGVVPDPDAAAAWYRKGAALGDEGATPLLGGMEPKASQ